MEFAIHRDPLKRRNRQQDSQPRFFPSGNPPAEGPLNLEAPQQSPPQFFPLRPKNRFAKKAPAPSTITATKR